MISTRALITSASLAISLGVLAASGAVAPAAAQTMSSHPHAGNPIHVNGCNATQGAPTQTFIGWYGRSVMQPGTPSTLAISYVNRSAKVAKNIDFGLVANGRLVAEVRDVGTFSPGAVINHTFGISNNVFPLGTGLYRCVALIVHFNDGSSFRSPRLAELSQASY